MIVHNLNELSGTDRAGGTGELEDLGTGLKHAIEPGVMYALGQHDRHVLRAPTNLKMICVFNPTCTGQKTYDEEGAYPLIAEASVSGPNGG